MIVLDASALLALLFREEGHEAVGQALGSACMSSVNLCEVLGRFARDGHDPGSVLPRLRATRVEFVPFDEELAASAAALIPLTQPRGLSLGDRACLSLALARRIPVLTADRAWTQIRLGVDVRCIR